jgi:hypothetical protein
MRRESNPGPLSQYAGILTTRSQGLNLTLYKGIHKYISTCLNTLREMIITVDVDCVNTINCHSKGNEGISFLISPYSELTRKDHTTEREEIEN